MPSKNALKEYEAGGYYHLYNRGVNKRLIFKNQQDYSTFISYLQFYLSPPNRRGLSSTDRLPVRPSHQLKNYADEIELLAYCLMPNHYHLMLKQNTDYGISHFMSSVITKYVRYFNTRYNRIGPLFQGRYKAVHVTNESQFIYLSKYIHRNPLDLPAFEDDPRRLGSYKYSSYGNYLGLFNQSWVSTQDILSYFSQSFPSNSYQNFVEESDPDDITRIAPITLDLD